MTDEKWSEYLILSKAWRTLMDKQNYYLNQSNEYLACEDHRSASDYFSQYIGYGKACSDVFQLMQDLDKPKQLDMELKESSL